MSKNSKNDRFLLGKPVLENITQDRVTSFANENSKLQFEAGMRPRIIRTSSGHCCDWCDAVAGVYEYPNVPQEVWRRHKNCDCTVEYDPGNGKRQNPYTKAWSESDRRNMINEIQAISNADNAYINERATDVTNEYLRKATVRKKELIIEEGTNDKNKKGEIEIANLISTLFGGKITVKAEVNAYKMKNPDYIWDGKMWEQKNVSSKNSINKHIQKALHQIEKNPGGIVLEISGRTMSRDDTINYILNRLEARRKMNLDVIIIEGDTLIKVIRYKK